MKTYPLALRVTEEMNQRLDELVVKTKRSKADLIRDAIELGLDDLGMVQKTELERLKEEVAAIKAAKKQPDPPARNATVTGHVLRPVKPKPSHTARA